MSKNSEMTFKDSFVTGIENFFRTKKVLVWAILIATVAVIIFLFVWRSVSRNIVEDSTLMAEDTQEMYQKWIIEDNEQAKTKLETQMLEEMSSIFEKYPHSYAAQRALFTRAKYYLQIKDLEKASTDFFELASSFPGGLLAEESLLNAASCQEELGNYSKSIDYYNQFQQDYTDSHQFTYSLFSSGRIYELMEEYPKAVEAYNTLETDYPDSGWTKLAQNRLIYIKVNDLEK